MQIFRYLCVVACLYSSLASAIILNPTVMALDIDKGGFAQVVITNNASARLPLEVSVHQLIFDQDGSYQPQVEPAFDLMVFPPAAMIEPGQKQAFRLQWGGGSALPTSQSFFVRFAQIQLGERDSSASPGHSDVGVNIQINYNALLHVYSEQQRVDVVLQVDDQGNAQLTNRGDRFTYTNQLHFDDIPSVLQTQVEAVVGDRFIAPRTRLIVDAGTTLPAGDYHARENGL